MVALLRNIAPFEYVFSSHEGWSGLPDSELLAVADQYGFAILMTTDQNMVHQQNLNDRNVGLVVLGTTDNDTLVANVSLIAVALKSITRPGKVVSVPLVTPKPVQRKKR